MSKLTGLLPIVMLAAAGQAHAGESLWCRVESNQLGGTYKAAKVTPFGWNASSGDAEPTGPLKTSIGTIASREGRDFTTLITVNGKAVPMSPAVTGLIWGGQAHDFGGKVALVFLVETATDSSATPTEAILVLGKDGRLIEQAVLPGEPATSNPCPLL